MQEPEIFQFASGKGIELKMTLYRSEVPHKKTTILYFHGGGLIYGTRNDFPSSYLKIFLHAGYDFLALDYPLAPESNLDTILEASNELVIFYLENNQSLLDLSNENYVLFGRSAGAYLVFMLCDSLRRNGITPPKALICLYGYTRLDEKSFLAPSKYYKTFPNIDLLHLERIVGDSPITNGPINTRFALYAAARQDGTWVKTLCGNESPQTYSLGTQSLAALPPTILSAATMDPDVPYRMSKSLTKVIPDSKLITIYSATHDFDRDTSDPTGLSVYNEIIQWMDNL